ncbi:uncharacterized protein LOC143010641 [Genypterus blacodes]|uniref:uncharacterized protein LOC143010640 n=1 Tax=Genypterus blacodes TaxID=154954 RepID=UPI003F76FD33
MEITPICIILTTLRCHSRSQYFQYECVILRCAVQGNSSSNWTVKRNTSFESFKPCDDWGIQHQTFCEIRNAFPSDTGVYWCESERGEHSNVVNISVVKSSSSEGSVILEGPTQPVEEGKNVTLLCFYKEQDGVATSDFAANFYKDNAFVGIWTEGRMTLSAVSKFHEARYKCEHPKTKQSPESWLTVRERPPPSTTPTVPPSMPVPRLVCTVLLVALYGLICVLCFYVHRHWTQGRAERKKRTSGRSQLN